jgi:hypothetical protein
MMSIDVKMVIKGEKFTDDEHSECVAEEDGYLVRIGDAFGDVSAFIGKSVFLGASIAVEGVPTESVPTESVKEFQDITHEECKDEIRSEIRKAISGDIPESVESQIEAVADMWAILGKDTAMSVLGGLIRGELGRFDSRRRVFLGAGVEEDR